MNKELELLKNSTKALALAQASVFEALGAYQSARFELEDKHEQEMKRLLERQKAYRDKLKAKQQDEYATLHAYEVKKAEAEENEQFVAKERDNAVANFLQKHQLTTADVLKLLQQETGKEWKVIKRCYTDGSGYDGVMSCPYVCAGVRFYLINSDFPCFENDEEALNEIKRQEAQRGGRLLPSCVKRYYEQLFFKVRDKEETKKKFYDSKELEMDWMKFYLISKGLAERELGSECLSNNKLERLVFKAIENQYIKHLEDENGEEKE